MNHTYFIPGTLPALRERLLILAERLGRLSRNSNVQRGLERVWGICPALDIA